MFTIIIAWWIIVYSLRRRATRKYFLIGVLSLMYYASKVWYELTLGEEFLHGLAFWTKMLILIGLLGYSLWSCRKEQSHGT